MGNEIKALQDGNRIRHEGNCHWCGTFETHLKPSGRWMCTGEFICAECETQMQESKR